MSDYEVALNYSIRYLKTHIEDEWYFENFREKFINSTSPSEAFELIDKTTSYLMEENDLSASIEILQTIINLANKSNTTQIPDNILLFKEKLTKKFNDEYYQRKIYEFLSFYRIA